MKLVLQRVKKASVSVDGSITGNIGPGLLILLGVHEQDTTETADFLVKKCSELRIFSDQNDKMNLSVKDIDGEALVVSQFTLLADCNKGEDLILPVQQIRKKAISSIPILLTVCASRNPQSGDRGFRCKHAGRID